MEPQTEEQLSNPPKLRRQDMVESDKACAAFAFINAIRLAGLNLPHQNEEDLITNSQQGAPLQDSERKGIADALRLNYHPLSEDLFDIPRNVESVFQFLNSTLSKNPVVFTVSRYLAKRPEKSGGERNYFHAVTAHMIDGKIEVIDPYSPYNPEVFNPALQEDKERFLGWFISPYLQNLGAKNTESIINDAGKFLDTPDNFQKAIKGVVSLNQTYSIGKNTYAKT